MGNGNPLDKIEKVARRTTEHLQENNKERREASRYFQSQFDSKHQISNTRNVAREQTPTHRGEQKQEPFPLEGGRRPSGRMGVGNSTFTSISTPAQNLKEVWRTLKPQQSQDTKPPDALVLATALGTRGTSESRVTTIDRIQSYGKILGTVGKENPPTDPRLAKYKLNEFIKKGSAGLDKVERDLKGKLIEKMKETKDPKAFEDLAKKIKDADPKFLDHLVEKGVVVMTTEGKYLSGDAKQKTTSESLREVRQGRTTKQSSGTPTPLSRLAVQGVGGLKSGQQQTTGDGSQVPIAQSQEPAVKFYTPVIEAVQKAYQKCKDFALVIAGGVKKMVAGLIPKRGESVFGPTSKERGLDGISYDKRLKDGSGVFHA